MQTRTCPYCNCTKELNSSNFRLRSATRFDIKCRKCAYKKQAPITKAWMLSHPKRILTQDQKDRIRANRIAWRNRNPWFAAYKTSTTRCLYDTNSSYYKRGIPHTATLADFKEVWIRDNATNMKEPSINRIDSSLGYFKDNIEYMELSENLECKKSPRWQNSYRDA